MIRMICKLGKMIDEDPAVRGKAAHRLPRGLLRQPVRAPDARLRSVRSRFPGRHRGFRHWQHEVHAERRDHAGTLDGANVEIADAAGHENEIIFGMLTPEVNALKGMGYHPNAFINGDNTAMAVLGLPGERAGTARTSSEVTSNLHNSDPYMVMGGLQRITAVPSTCRNCTATSRSGTT